MQIIIPSIGQILYYDDCKFCTNFSLLKWNEKPIVPWRAKASSFEGQLNVYACDELFSLLQVVN